MSPVLFTWRNIQKASRTRLHDNFADQNVAYSYGVVRRYGVPKFTADAILFREIQCKKRDILMFKQRFQSFGWNKVNMQE